MPKILIYYKNFLKGLPARKPLYVTKMQLSNRYTLSNVNYYFDVDNYLLKQSLTQPTRALLTFPPVASDL